MKVKVYQMMRKIIVGMSFQTNLENQIKKEDNKKTSDFISMRIIKNWVRIRSNRNKFNDNSFFFYINIIFFNLI